MRRIAKRLEDIFSAVAFTEAAEFDRALELFRWVSLAGNFEDASITPAVPEGCP